MKNKKGFTLIELIVAIVLLAVIGIILGFSINNMIKKNTQKEYQRFKDTITSSASTYISLNRDAIEELYANKSYEYITLGELIDKGLLDENLTNPYTKEKIDRSDVIKINLDALTGSAVFTYPVEETSDEGISLIAMADILDEDGVFNCMDGAGSYKLALAKEDGNLIHLGNAAGSIYGSLIKTYDIKCKVPKEFTEAEGSVDAVVDDGVYRSFKNYKVKEGSYDVEYTWLGTDKKVHKIKRVVSIKGKKFEAKFNANKGMASVPYIIVMNGAMYGELATATRPDYIFGGWYYDGSLIVPDTIVYATETHTLKARWLKPPTITSTGYHKDGAIITPINGYVYTDKATIVYYGPEDNDDTLSYFIRSTSATKVSVSSYACGNGDKPGNCGNSGTTNISANVWYKVGSAKKSGSTTITVSYENHNDNYANLETYVTNVKGYGGPGGSVTIKKIDRKAPINCDVIGNGTMGNNSYYLSDINIGPEGTDLESGLKSKTVDRNLINADTTGVEVTTTLYDKVGNSTSCKKTFKRDVTKPQCVSGGGVKWTNTSVTLYGTCVDATSKCTGNITSPAYTTQGHWVNQSPGRVYDNAGNWVDCPANQEIGIDLTKPSCTSSDGNANWINYNLTLKGTCGDTGGSGCTGNISKTYSTNTNSTTESPGRVYDYAGNWIDCPANQTVKIDKSSPTCTSRGGSASWTNGNVIIEGICGDSGGSGCTGNVSKTYTTNTNSTTESPGRVYDYAGNWADCANQTVKIDKDAPTCASKGGSTSWTNGNITIEGTCSDTGGSGCTGNVSKTYSTNTNSTTESPGRVYDYAGNWADCANQTVKIDKDVPTCSVKKTSTGTTDGVSATATCSDTGGSGCKTPSKDKTGLKSNYTYTFKDNAGNEGSCKATVTSQVQKKSCTGTKCTAYNTKCVQYNKVCANTVTNTSQVSSATGCNEIPSYARCPSGATNCTCTCDGSTGGGSSVNCTYSYCSSLKDGSTCLKTENTTCKTSECSSWGSWTNVNSCSAKADETQCQTIYK